MKPTTRTIARPLTDLTRIARQFFITAQVFLDPNQLHPYQPLEETGDSPLDVLLTELSYHLHSEKPWQPVTIFLERRDNRRLVEVSFAVSYQTWENGQRVTLRWADETPA